MSRDDLPARVFAKHGRYYYVEAQGRRRVWHPLTRISEGLPAMYTALADAQSAGLRVGMMPGLCAAWMRDVMPRHAEHTQDDDRRRCGRVADAFAEFRPDQVTPPDCAAWLRQWEKMPRSYNAHRSMLRELMRYAEELGQRDPGSNPVQALRTMRTPARTRYITDSEFRRIKVAAMRRQDGGMTRGGPMLCALLDVAYLTGQRVSDVLRMEWPQITGRGVLFAPSKVAKSTGARVLIEWSPRLRDVVERLRAMRRDAGWIGARVFLNTKGQPMTYVGLDTAWQRALEASGVAPCQLRDFRARALTDVAAKRGMIDANTMGAHATQSQTADYVRHKTARKTGATR